MKHVPSIPQDTALAIVGLAALAFGLALIDVRLAFVVVGALLLAYAILPDRKEPSS